MSLITDALRKADDSLSTPPPQTSSPKPRVDLTPPPPPPASRMRWSHAVFLVGCIVAGYLLFAHRPAPSLRSQKIAVMRIPRSLTRPHPADSYETAGIPRSVQPPQETAKSPFSTTLSPQTTGSFPSTKNPSLFETRRAAIPLAAVQSSPLADNKIGMDLFRAVASQWRLNGIIRGGTGKALALVNNELVQEGDSFHGARVVRISDDQVMLEANGQMQTLRLD